MRGEAMLSKEWEAAAWVVLAICILGTLWFYAVLFTALSDLL